MFKAVRSKKAQTRLPMFHFLFMVSLLGEKKKKLFSQKRTKRHGASVSRMPHKTPEPRQHTQQQ